MTSSNHRRVDFRDAPAPADPRNPGDDYLNDELERNRRDEYQLIGKAGLALLFVVVLVVVRQLFFV